MRIVYRAVNKFVRKTNWYNQYWGGVSKFWYLNTFNIDVVNLGSTSAVHAFDYSVQTDIKCMNWAIGPQSLLHDFNILKNYFSYLKTGALVIIPLCPFSGLKTKYDSNHNFKYYTFLHPATIQNFQEIERIRALKIQNNPSKEIPLICCKETVKEIYNKILPNHNRGEFVNNADLFINNWKKQFGVTDFDFPISELNKKELTYKRTLLEQIIIFCNERDFNVSVVIPPIHPTLSSYFTDVFFDNYIYPLIEALPKYDVMFYNYMNDQEICKDEFFINSFFLNSKGARLFTSKFLYNTLGL